MQFGPKEIVLKNGKACTLRSARREDAENLIAYMKITAGETRYLLREPEEAAQAFTPEREEEFLQSCQASDRELMLLAESDDRLLGCCSFSSLGSLQRCAHRCGIAIALYRSAWGQGLGTAMLQTLLEEAKRCGYEQAELDVVTTNAPAIHLYQKLGFEIYGTQPRSMKYPDGSYADFYLMSKLL